MAFKDFNEHLFVLGSARSGTSLMASIVQNTPAYASYRAETKLLNSCQSKYGNLANKRSREHFLDDWFQSRQFKRAGLSEEAIRLATQNENSYIGFLGIYMNMVAQSQGCQRWIDSTPSNANCLHRIALTFPNAKVLHMVRDGRAVAMSLAKLGWSGARTKNFDTALVYAAMKWRFAVDKVYSNKSFFKDRYLQVKYEDLVLSPKETLANVSAFLEIPDFDISMLDGRNVDRNESVNSSLRTPNSLFGDMEPGISSNAAFRWKNKLTKKQIALIEACVAEDLQKYGYSLLSSAKAGVVENLLNIYRASALKGKRLLKHHTLLGRMSVSPLEIGED